MHPAGCSCKLGHHHDEEGCMTPSFHTEARPYCYRCFKPRNMCLCGLLTPIPNAVGVHVLQHPRESRHPLGTARLLRLGLASVRIHVLSLRDGSAVSAPVVLPEGAGLLYPSADARDLSTLAAEEQPERLVVIDGTWDQAHRVFRDNSWISALPRYRLALEEGSRYRIRPEPRLECLSTVESVAAALRYLQPDLRGTETLLSAFDAMIDAQIMASARPSTHHRGKRIRRKPPRPVPDVLLASNARIVVVYAEAAPRQTMPPGPGVPIRLSAVTIDGTRVFDRMIRPRTSPNDFFAAKLELESRAFETAQPCHEVMAAFHEFCEASSSGAPLVFVSWNVWTQRWLEASFSDIPCVLLKGVWANLSRVRVPALDVLVDGLGLAISDLPVMGRAGRRLMHTHAMALHILNGAADAP